MNWQNITQAGITISFGIIILYLFSVNYLASIPILILLVFLVFVIEEYKDDTL